MGETATDRVEVSLALAERAGRVLVRQRALGTHLAGLWEFPGGKLEPGESPLAAARRELGEETGLAGGACEPLGVQDFAYPTRGVRLHVFLVRDPQGVPDPAGGWIWVALGELEALPMPEANGPIVAALRRRLAS